MYFKWSKKAYLWDKKSLEMCSLFYYSRQKIKERPAMFFFTLHNNEIEEITFCLVKTRKYGGFTAKIVSDFSKVFSKQ